MLELGSLKHVFRSWEALVKNVPHVNLHGADCLN